MTNNLSDAERVKKAQDAIAAVCAEYQVQLWPTYLLSPEGMTPRLEIRPIPEKNRIVVPKINPNKLDLNRGTGNGA